MSHLIFDVGMHRGEDSHFYLSQGHRVVAIDADINFVNKAKEEFHEYINTEQFTVLHYAVSDVDDEEVNFHISKENVWSSLKVEIADRRDCLHETIQVKTKTLPTLFRTYGTPHYCKIDIEGYDDICLQTLHQLSKRPDYISVESECLADDQEITEQEALSTLRTMYELGYTKFKLVDQNTLATLTPDKKFYHPGSIRAIKKLLPNKSQRARYKAQFNHHFQPGATGPFGEDVHGEWMDYTTAEQTLLRHRKDYYKLSNSTRYGFWCDWHATT